MNDADLRLIASKYETIVIWGLNHIGEYLCEFLSNTLPSKSVVLCDNDSIKRKNYSDYEIISSEEAIKRYPDGLFILGSCTYYDVMKQELLERNVPEKNILLARTVEAEAYEKECLKRKKTKRLNKIQFEIDISRHCNLDCNCCSQFAPLAKPEFIDLDEMNRDFSRLSKLFKGVAERIYLIGGEPLLFPEIEQCLDIARDAFPDSKIDIFTNGLLLNSKKESFWDRCIKDDIGIIVTRYPIDVNYEAVEAYVKSKGVKFEFAGTSSDFKFMSNIGLDINGNQDPEDSFIHCYEANNCIKLRGGRLYTCTRPVAIDKFNDYFGLELKECEQDSIDIYQAMNSDEVLEFLSKPIPFCRYCNLSKNRVAREWSHSTKRIDEWT